MADGQVVVSFHAGVDASLLRAPPCGAGVLLLGELVTGDTVFLALDSLEFMLLPPTLPSHCLVLDGMMTRETAEEGVVRRALRPTPLFVAPAS